MKTLLFHKESDMSLCRKGVLLGWGMLVASLMCVVCVPAVARKKEFRNVKKVVRGFSAIDTAYIEPQHFEFTAMLQTTFTYDIYELRSPGGQSITFSPDVIMKVGPYFGWRWFFLGYTFDLKNIGFSSDKRKQELDLSIYSSQIGVDFYYRRTGSDYKIRDVNLGDDTDMSGLSPLSFDGLSVGITGASLYYIFNHNRFSYPAAFSQSTCQKISCGSWMAGIGYTRNSLDLDYGKLQDAVNSYMGRTDVKLDSGMMFNSVKYYNANVSVGYGYNWVFAKNCLLNASLSAVLAYKRSKGDTNDGVDEFSFNNVNFDGVGRFGIVYNNMRWYVGASAIIHSNNYRKPRFQTNQVFGSMNIYAGYNFGKKKKYRKK
ncbi:DUF4421 domain-containing protein [Xylanibacter muris]|nr:DUF4421 domain-containing protein [Xylanibacter muris]